VLALVGTAAGIYYYTMRPVLLQVAVGPPNSDDAKVVQALVQAFARSHKQIRLHPLLTNGAVASAAALSDGQADLAIVRGDLDVPKNAQAVATLRKSIAVLWVPPNPKVKKKKMPLAKLRQSRKSRNSPAIV
jgi:DNA-binding transcriptional LysR family regulator